MKRRLFLTGPIGCGKSTAIETAIGGLLPQFGGFLTRRKRDENGRARSFSIVSPDGSFEAIFLDFSSGKPDIRMEVFQTASARMMQGRFLVLDEIGGFELLSPVFLDALDHVLDENIPILGVLKGESAGNALIRALGLTGEYNRAATQLRSRLLADEDTMIYECEQFDPNALRLAEEWVSEYAIK